MVTGIAFYIVLLISLVVHEAAHAVTALWGGDKTAYLGGQVTLNPIPHIQREPFGMVFLPIGLLFLSGGQMCMGFAHAPIDRVWAYHHPRKAALMSAAGPLSNFLMAFLAAVVMKILANAELVHVADGYSFPFEPADGAREGAVYAACLILTIFMFLNVILGVLNLIPVPPLDGAGVVGGLFPKTAGKLYEFLRGQPIMMIAVMVLIFWNMQDRGGILFDAFRWPYHLLVDFTRSS